MFFVVLGVVAALIILSGFRVIMQYERGLVFTFGHYSHTMGPGLNWLLPGVQTLQKIDMRIETVDIPKQEVITKDNIPVNINAVVYFHVKSPEAAVIKVSDYMFADVTGLKTTEVHIGLEDYKQMHSKYPN